MKLALIVPWHDEPVAQLVRVLTSIDAQLEIDFGQMSVYVVADGRESFPERVRDALIHYSPTILQTSGDVGPGLTRQHGIDLSVGEYLMFLDADDVLQDVFALSRFWRASTDHDLIVSPYTKESFDGEFQYHRSADIESSAVYAKWYRRGYLEQIGLRFSPELRVYEDAYFVNLALLMTTDVAVLKQPSYVWLRNMNSIGRRDNFAMAHQLDQWAKSYRLRLAFLQSHHSAQFTQQFWSYVVKAFFHIQIFKPYDVQAFLQEHRRLLTTVGRYCRPLSVQELVRRAEQLQPRVYPSLTMNGFAKYAENQLVVVRQVSKFE